MTPATPDELAAILRDASERGQAVVPWGAGTLQHLGYPPHPEAIILHTAALNRIVEYNPADLTITVEAGATLGAVQETLRPHGQWLPWDPPAPGAATLGGLLAAGASGPLRLGYGAPRDWVLGMRVALGDGRLIKSGGKVVKNVAGYETHKLQIGALGTLGVIVEVTFKLSPLPERTGSLALACARREEAAALLERLRVQPLAPVSLALVGRAAGPLAAYLPGDPGRGLVVVRFAGVAAAVERQLRAAFEAATASGADIAALDDEQSEAIWQQLAAFPAASSSSVDSRADTTVADGAPLVSPRESAPTGEHLLIRAGAAASALPATLSALERHAPPAEEPVQTVGYGGVGLAYARWPMPGAVEVGALASALSSLRAALAELGGYAVVEDAPPALRSQLDLWGPPPETLPLMRAIKAQWDPRGVLNPGRYVGGL